MGELLIVLSTQLAPMADPPAGYGGVAETFEFLRPSTVSQPVPFDPPISFVDCRGGKCP